MKHHSCEDFNSSIKSASLQSILAIHALSDTQLDALFLTLRTAQRMDALLQRLTPIGAPHDAYLAGGALRDCMVMENPQIKDLDIFWHPPEELWQRHIDGQESWENILKPYFKNIKSVRSKNQEFPNQEHASYFAHSIVDILKIQLDEQSAPVDLILTPGKAFHFIFKYFDFSICKIAIPLQLLQLGAISPPSKQDQRVNHGIHNKPQRAAPHRYVHPQNFEDAPTEPPIAFPSYWEKLKTRYMAQHQSIPLESITLYFRDQYFSLLQTKRVYFEGFTYNEQQASYAFNEHWQRIAHKIPHFTPTLPTDVQGFKSLQRHEGVYELTEKWVLEHTLQNLSTVTPEPKARRL